MSYYQKYRSDKVAQLDLVAVRSAFETMMRSGEVAHAYLFVGPRGLGKTSAARILARLVNCEKNNTKGKLNKKLNEPCGECDSCISVKKGSAVDVMEIDAASHRGIDDIRELRERVNLAPTALPKKVYIIDEVHMLTTEAFNALLKTLEEPPAHAMFILATTEAHKVPETIVSRCVRVNFTKATPGELKTSLLRAVRGEGLKIDDEALATLAAGLDGSFREGHKLLEQLANQYDPIKVENVVEALHLVSDSRLTTLLAAVKDGETDKVVMEMAALEAEGAEPVSLISRMLMVLQNRLREAVAQGSAPGSIETRLMRRLVKTVPKVKISPLPLLPLELVLVETALACREAGDSRRRVVEKPIDINKKVEVDRRMRKADGVSERPVEKAARSERVVDQVDLEGVVGSPEAQVNFDQVVAGWPELLSRLQPRNHSVAGLLRSAKPKAMGDKFLTIEVFYKFHKDQLDQEARRRIIEEEIAKLWGPISVKCVLGEKVAHQAAAVVTRPVTVSTTEAAADDVVREVEEIFGI